MNNRPKIPSRKTRLFCQTQRSILRKIIRLSVCAIACFLGSIGCELVNEERETMDRISITYPKLDRIDRVAVTPDNRVIFQGECLIGRIYEPPSIKTRAIVVFSARAMNQILNRERRQRTDPNTGRWQYDITDVIVVQKTVARRDCRIYREDADDAERGYKEIISLLDGFGNAQRIGSKPINIEYRDDEIQIDYSATRFEFANYRTRKKWAYPLMPVAFTFWTATFPIGVLGSPIFLYMAIHQHRHPPGVERNKSSSKPPDDSTPRETERHPEADRTEGNQ